MIPLPVCVFIWAVVFVVLIGGPLTARYGRPQSAGVSPNRRAPVGAPGPVAPGPGASPREVTMHNG